MKTFDFWLQCITLILYTALSPIVFGILYPTTGDVSLIWIWVVVVTGITSLISLILFVVLNLLIPPKKTYKLKALVPMVISYFLMYNIGTIPNERMETMFLIGNFSLLVVLYSAYGFVFFKKINHSRG